MNLQSIVSGYITDKIADMVGSKFGLSQKQSRTVVATVVPLLLGAMAKNAGKSKSGASSLFGAIQNDHDGSIFTQLSELGSAGEKSNGAKIIQHVLGAQKGDVISALAKSEGVESGQVSDVMETIAPLVMGALGKEQSEKSLDVGALAGLFSEQEESASQQKAQNPLLAMLDQDGDGNSTDDLLSMGMKALKNFGKK